MMIDEVFNRKCLKQINTVAFDGSFLAMSQSIKNDVSNPNVSNLQADQQLSLMHIIYNYHKRKSDYFQLHHDNREDQAPSVLRIEVKPIKLSGQDSVIILINDETQIINSEKGKLKQNFQ